MARYTQHHNSDDSTDLASRHGRCSHTFKYDW
ncbi:hypothetical protein ACRTSV_004690, partial [Escherichia coli]